MISYQLDIRITEDLEMKIGKLGTFKFPIGQYVYTGSAKKNINKRIKRHKSKKKKLHWHIDYLLNNQNVKIKRIKKSSVKECELNKETKGEIIVKGFGSTDCKNKCGSHLKMVDKTIKKEEKKNYRVQKLLSNYGHCSRRKGEELIEAGRVKVNNKTISLGHQARKEDEIKVDNKVVKKENKRYIMFNKPIGCVTALTDREYKTVMDYIKTQERIFPIGRLDYNTSGLLILTNDGDFGNKIMHPRYETKKTYKIHLKHPLTTKQEKNIRTGVELEDGKTLPAKLTKVDKSIYEIVIHEGRNRIIRRMAKKIGVQIKTLERIRIKDLKLGQLKEGEYRDLTEKEIEQFL